MPGFDGTGPLGQGPMTGRGLGKCNPETKDRLNELNDLRWKGRRHRFRGDEAPGGGRGAGLGQGRGRGLRRGRGQGRG